MRLSGSASITPVRLFALGARHSGRPPAILIIEDGQRNLNFKLSLLEASEDLFFLVGQADGGEPEFAH
jgi:hypothetical protein